MADDARRPLLRTVVGETLRRHRQEQRRTLAEVARAANVSLPYLSEVERGRKEPSSEVLAAVCDALRLDLPDLLDEVRRELVALRTPVLRLAGPASVVPMRRQVVSPSRRPGGGEVLLLAA